jgi:hypothetical protein
MMSNHSNGMKFDSDKPDYSLVPFEALDEVVKVLTYGANKYDRFNWEKVEDIRYQAAALRHISAYMQGEKYDPETGINHLAHAVCSLLFLTQFDLNSKKESTQLNFNFSENTVYNDVEVVYNGINKTLDDVTPAEWNEAAYRAMTNGKVS